ncbi:MAG: hypothetical protein M1838_004263 [Thelocarpon superellum]|nr:MAG: hypothetical protein M1838_004263 [Thelocarpon superellum]
MAELHPAPATSPPGNNAAQTPLPAPPTTPGAPPSAAPLLQPPTHLVGRAFQDADELVKQLNLFAAFQGYAVVKRRCSDNKRGEVSAIYRVCDRYGAIRTTATKRATRESKRCNRPFSAVLRLPSTFPGSTILDTHGRRRTPPASTG